MFPECSLNKVEAALVEGNKAAADASGDLASARQFLEQVGWGFRVEDLGFRV
jgi:hypothetical protein